ncbi:EH domain-containing protein 2-like isoform X1 [Glycine soja]|uniref:EH domain-containing protein 2-like isoform X1 n=1 Tax=Glycine soja TaxID=3848 RepID=UPI00103D1386|nr:EH domain-containing protein 2-like isoform X1 [Glycine soja]
MRLGKKKIATKMKIESRSKEETKTYQEWFNLADSDGDGRISGNDTTKFFALSNLSRSQLKRLWALADVKRQGFLGFTEFVTAMQLVSLAQVGQELNSDILKTQSKFDKENIKPPVLEGLDALVAQMSLTINAPPEGLLSLKCSQLTGGLVQNLKESESCCLFSNLESVLVFMKFKFPSYMIPCCAFHFVHLVFALLVLYVHYFGDELIISLYLNI